MRMKPRLIALTTLALVLGAAGRGALAQPPQQSAPPAAMDSVVAAVDLPAHGASFGATVGSDNMGPEETLWDLHDVVGWLAEQSWSDGRLGMYGCSYVGVSQLLTAGTAPDGLKAIVPGGVPIDPVATSRSNGVSSTSLRHVDQILRTLDVATKSAAHTAKPESGG
jgi:predicted acyl esterase